MADPGPSGSGVVDLDSLGDLPSIFGDGTSSVCKRERDEPAKPVGTKRALGPQTPPSTIKRKRSGLLGKFGAPAEAVGSETRIVQDDAFATPGKEDGASDFVGNDADSEVEKVCIGCARSNIRGRDFLNPEALVPWALRDARGSFCRDCFNLWRLRFQDRSVALMQVHLASSPELFADWQLCLFAYLSVRRTGVERVSAAALSERIDLFQWLVKSVGMPIGRFHVEPLAMVDTPPRAADLVTLMDSDGRARLGVVSTRPLPKVADMLTVPRPQDPKRGIRDNMPPSSEGAASSPVGVTRAYEDLLVCPA